MTGEKILLWREGEYHYPAAYGFVPFMISYIHEDREIHPAMVMEWHTRRSDGSHVYYNSAFAFDFSSGQAGQWKELP